jgi:hypothetical protein
MTFLVTSSQVAHASRQICQTAGYVTNASQTAFIFTQLPILTTSYLPLSKTMNEKDKKKK